MPYIEIYCIPSQQTPHNMLQFKPIGPEQQMKVIGNQRSSKTVGTGFHQQPRHPFNK